MEEVNYIELLARELDGGAIDVASPDIVADIEALGRLPMPAAHYAATAFLQLGTPATPALERWIRAHGAPVLWAALGNGVRVDAGLEAFGALLDVEDEDLQAVGAAGVGKCGPAGRKFAARLRALAADGDADTWVRIHAISAVAGVGELDLELLAAAARDPDEELRRAGIGALGVLGPDAAPVVDVVCECLTDDELSGNAAIALARIGVATQAVGDALATAFEARDPEAMDSILYALGKLKAPSAAAQQTLRAALSLSDPAMRAVAAVALYLAIGETETVRREMPDSLSVLSDWHVDPQPFAQSIQAALAERALAGPPASTTDLIEHLQDVVANSQPDQMDLGDGLVIDVESATIDPDIVIRPDPADALAHLVTRLGDARAIPALQRIASDERNPAWTREFATTAANKLGARET